MAQSKSPLVYAQHMLREMQQTPEVLHQLCVRLLPAPAQADAALWPEAGLRAALKDCSRVLLVACGSSRHAGILGKYALAGLADVPAHIEEAHEMRSLHQAVWRDQSLCIALSQSGETRDTLEALRLADTHACPVLAICNVAKSTLVHGARWSLLLEAGSEVAVPATKTFVAQAFACVALAWQVGTLKDAQLGPAQADRQQRLADTLAGLQTLPQQAQTLLHALATDGPLREAMLAASHTVAHARQSVFVGRGAAAGIAAEGALKVAEAAYVAARAFSLGEIKHGPMAMLAAGEDALVALIDAEEEPSFATLAGVRRLADIGLPLVFIGQQGSAQLESLARDYPQAHVLRTAAAPPLVWPLLATIVLQRLALEVAAARGVDADAPRYLVKQITEK